MSILLYLSSSHQVFSIIFLFSLLLEDGMSGNGGVFAVIERVVGRILNWEKSIYSLWYSQNEWYYSDLHSGCSSVLDHCLEFSACMRLLLGASDGFALWKDVSFCSRLPDCYMKRPRVLRNTIYKSICLPTCEWDRCHERMLTIIYTRHCLRSTIVAPDNSKTQHQSCSPLAFWFLDASKAEK